MPAPTPKEIRLAAVSVRSARSAGIETQAAKAAPALLDAAETAFERMVGAVPADPSAPSQTAERRLSRSTGAILAYDAALKELRAALAG